MGTSRTQKKIKKERKKRPSAFGSDFPFPFELRSLRPGVVKAEADLKKGPMEAANDFELNHRPGALKAATRVVLEPGKMPTVKTSCLPYSNGKNQLNLP